ncbi:MAG: MYG1 family protein [Patescibacteria group bacterium]
MAVNKIIKLVTHDGSFHTDDVFAAAALSIMFEKEGIEFEIIRTRDEEIIKSADYVFDVGGIYDEGTNRFDHHQVGGAGIHKGEIGFSSFGLVWKKFGVKISGSDKSAQFLDNKLALPIDAWDNGYDLVQNNLPDTSPVYIQHLFFAMQPTWREEDLNIDEMFFKSVAIAKEFLNREIIQANDALLAEEAVMDAYNNTKDKRIIVLEKNYPAQHVLQEFPEPLFVIYPRRTNNYWGVKAMREDPKTFKNKKNLPVTWGSLKDEELQKVTGVPDAVFCHKGLFLAVAKTKEGAIKLAGVALES